MATIKETVIGMATVGSDGMISFESLEDCAKALGVDCDGADELIDDVLDELMSDGEVTEINGLHYMTCVLDDIADAEEESIAEMTAYHAAVEASWKAAKGIR